MLFDGLRGFYTRKRHHKILRCSIRRTDRIEWKIVFLMFTEPEPQIKLPVFKCSISLYQGSVVPRGYCCVPGKMCTAVLFDFFI